jgi:hypothetical protein
MKQLYPVWLPPSQMKTELSFTGAMIKNLHVPPMSAPQAVARIGSIIAG